MYIKIVWKIILEITVKIKLQYAMIKIMLKLNYKGKYLIIVYKQYLHWVSDIILRHVLKWNSQRYTEEGASYCEKQII